MNIFEKILELGFIELDSVPKDLPNMYQLIDGKWYFPRWGCDTLQHVKNEIEVLNTPKYSLKELGLEEDDWVEIRELINNEKIVEAIKKVRIIKGCTLREAKDAVYSLR